MEAKNTLNRTRVAVAAAAMAGSMLVGGVIGAVAFGATAASAATPTPTAAGAAPAQSEPAGTFRPNEDAAHEASESAQREAQENAGQRPTVP
jgi:hypothetical protein